jgi:diguanylate cyclase (GGDEF)-like protein/PAS domain S-box-containing protein
LEQARRLGDAMETVPSYVYMKDTEGRYTYVNGPMCELFGHTRDEILGVTNESFLDWSVSDDSHKNDLRVLDFGEYLMTEEVNVLAATGEARSYWVVKSPIKNDTGAVIGMCGISTDITENKRNQEELKLAKQAAESANRELSVVAKFNETILLNSPLPMGVYTASGQCVVANDAYAKLVGKSRESLLTENFYDIDEWKISGALECCVRAIAQHSPQQIEIELKTPAGNVVYAECRMLPTQLNNGDHILIQLIDLTARKLHEIELSKFAFNDSLTQLPNRRLFLDRLKHAQSASQRDQNHGAILFLDLNKFKYLNDTHGHEAGDQLLVEVAKRLKLVTRDVDTVARFGGDEFVVLIDGLGQDVELAKENAAIAADKIKKSLSEEYVIGEIRHHGSASVGIALFLGDADDPDQIIKDADAAMYEAKKARGSS